MQILDIACPLLKVEETKNYTFKWSNIKKNASKLAHILYYSEDNT